LGDIQYPTLPHAGAGDHPKTARASGEQLMRLVYVMDPLETMLPDKDTTFAFMRAAQRLGHDNLHCFPHQLSVEGGKAFAATRVAIIEDTPPQARYGHNLEVALSDVDAVLIRKDPPFDTAYLHATQVLDLARNDTFMMNDPRGLRDANEKLYALRFPQWMPRTYVSSEAVRIRAFMDACGGSAVIKPIGRAGGYGVMRLTTDDLNTPSIIELLTEAGNVPVMVQEYLPAGRIGDKRVLLLDGKVLGAVLRVPRNDDLRANIHVGGRVQACELTEQEKEMIASIGPHLHADGLYFVGLDVIGERLTEVNVTSPTGIQELGRLTGTAPELDVIRWLEREVARFARRRQK
jgi:glutathione synthase